MALIFFLVFFDAFQYAIKLNMRSIKKKIHNQMESIKQILLAICNLQFHIKISITSSSCNECINGDLKSMVPYSLHNIM